MEAWIWIPITFLAAFMQAARTAGQKYLTKDSFKYDKSKQMWYLSHAAHADIIRWGGLQ